MYVIPMARFVMLSVSATVSTPPLHLFYHPASNPNNMGSIGCSGGMGLASHLASKAGFTTL